MKKKNTFKDVFLIILSLIVSLSFLSETLWGQYYVSEQGHLLDANPRLGSFGLNTQTRLDSLVPRANLYVTGNVSGGASFQGLMPYSSSQEFQSTLGSSDLSNFRRDSVGVQDLSRPVGQQVPYIDPSMSVTRSRGNNIVNTQNMYSRQYNATGTNYQYEYDDSRLSTRPLSRTHTLGVSQTIPEFKIIDTTGSGAAVQEPWMVENQLRDMGISRRGVVDLPQTTTTDTYGTQGQSPAQTAEQPQELTEYQGGRETTTTDSESETDFTGRGVQPEATGIPNLEIPGLQSETGDQQTQDGTNPEKTPDYVWQRTTPAPFSLPQLPSEQTGQSESESNEQTESVPGGFTDRTRLLGSPSNQGALISPTRASVMPGPLSGGNSVGLAPVERQESIPNTSSSSSVQNLINESTTRFTNKLANTYRQEVSYYMDRGNSLMQQRRYYQAANAFGTAALYQPRSGKILLSKAQALFCAGEYMSAAYFLNQAVELDPQLASVDDNFRRILPEQKKLQEQMDELDLWQQRSGQPMLKFLKGYILYSTGDIEQAYQALTDAGQLLPQVKSVNILLKAVEAKRGNNPAAKQGVVTSPNKGKS